MDCRFCCVTEATLISVPTLFGPSDLCEECAAERADLDMLEATVDRAVQAFSQAGLALREIRDRRLYRAEFTTFEAYCAERWNFSRPRAYQLIEAAGVVETVSTIVDTAPANEAQARPLTRLPKEQQAKAWQEAVESAPNGKPTAAHVESVVVGKLDSVKARDDDDDFPCPHTEDGSHDPDDDGDCRKCFHPCGTQPTTAPAPEGDDKLTDKQRRQVRCSVSTIYKNTLTAARNTDKVIDLLGEDDELVQARNLLNQAWKIVSDKQRSWCTRRKAGKPPTERNSLAVAMLAVSVAVSKAASEWPVGYGDMLITQLRQLADDYEANPEWLEDDAEFVPDGNEEVEF